MALKVYQSFLTLTTIIELTENSSGQIEIALNDTDKITSIELHQVLHNSLIAYEELDIKILEMPSGPSGLIACICFICIEYVRQDKN